MSEARLATSIEASALIARAQSEGGFGVILARGDAERGALLIVLLERGMTAASVQRLLQGDGRYRWESRKWDDSANLQQHVARARDSDPDLWVIELDVPSAERFIAGMTPGD